MILKLEDSVKTQCDNGRYIATITNVAFQKLNNGNTILRVRLRFKDADGNRVEIGQIYPPKFTKNSGFYELLMAVGFDEMEVGEKIQTDQLIGEKVRITVENVEKKSGIYSNVTSYREYVPKTKRTLTNTNINEEGEV